MNPPPRSVLVWGAPQPPDPPRLLRAGPVTVEFDPADARLRAVRRDGREVLRGIYGAIRDQHWGTIPGQRRMLVDHSGPDAFELRWESVHQTEGIDFLWRGAALGSPDGTIVYEFEGIARGPCLKNRIGLCVLHPLDGCAGYPCLVRHRDGTRSWRPFPRWVAVEQPVDGFRDLAGLTHEGTPGCWVAVEFEGEEFETEDQRNWIDASFKTYSTALTKPYPVTLPAGAEVRHRVTVRWLDASDLDTPPPARVEVRSPEPLSTDGDFVALPQGGVQAAAHGRPLSEDDLAHLATLQLAHLRVDLDLRAGSTALRPVLQRVAREATDLGLSLELALHLPASGPDALEELRSLLQTARADVARLLALQTGTRSTPADALDRVRAAFGDWGIPIGSGTGGDLYQLHLEPPATDGDFLCWSMNPQVHAFDTRSIFETPAGARDQLATQAHRHPDRPLVISPITLKPRPSPFPALPGQEVPVAGIDPRQASLVAAVWTVGMLASLVHGGAEAVTFFETTGTGGLMAGSVLGTEFRRQPAFAGMMYPVFHVFRALAGARRGRRLEVNREPGGEGFGLEVQLPGGRPRLVLANPTRQPLLLHPRASAPTGRVRRLQDATLSMATTEPTRFWSAVEPESLQVITLGPGEIAFVDPEQLSQ